MRLYTLKDAEVIIARELHRIRGFDTIIGLPRSGMIFASFIATQLEVSLSDVISAGRSMRAEKHGHIVQGNLGKILLVEDVVNKGIAIREATPILEAAGIKRDQFVTCSIWTNPTHQPSTVDIDLGGPHDPAYAFTWQMWHSARWPNWATDMDGVLCCDSPGHPSFDAYKSWALIAKARWIPSPRRSDKWPVGAIITSRPEGIRLETNAWLARHGIRYEKLIMVPVDTEEEVMPWLKSKQLTRGSWKAREVNQLGKIEMFIESHQKQAEQISREFGGLVWCTDTQERYRSGSVVSE